MPSMRATVHSWSDKIEENKIKKKKQKYTAAKWIRKRKRRSSHGGNTILTIEVVVEHLALESTRDLYTNFISLRSHFMPSNLLTFLSFIFSQFFFLFIRILFSCSLFTLPNTDPVYWHEILLMCDSGVVAPHIIVIQCLKYSF